MAVKGVSVTRGILFVGLQGSPLHMWALRCYTWASL